MHVSNYQHFSIINREQKFLFSTPFMPPSTVTVSVNSGCKKLAGSMKPSVVDLGDRRDFLQNCVLRVSCLCDWWHDCTCRPVTKTVTVYGPRATSVCAVTYTWWWTKDRESQHFRWWLCRNGISLVSECSVYRRIGIYKLWNLCILLPGLSPCPQRCIV